MTTQPPFPPPQSTVDQFITRDGQIFATRVLSDDALCVSCGHRAVIVSQWFRLAARGLLLPHNGVAGPSAEALGEEAYSLCLRCLRREHRIASGGEWLVADSLEGWETNRESQ